MEMVVKLVHPGHRLMFELLAATGLRRSELLALEGRHLALEGQRPYVKVRQRVRRQRKAGLVIGALKSRHARRDVPIPLDLADRLRALHTGPRRARVRKSHGTVLDPDNLYKRVLTPACEEAGVEWAGFHTFRHTVASRLFAEGRNVVQVQRWLGHHSASFTLDTYVHLLEADVGLPLEPSRVNTGSTPTHAKRCKRRLGRRAGNRGLERKTANGCKRLQARKRLPKPKVAGSRPVVRFVEPCRSRSLRVVTSAPARAEARSRAG